MSTKQWAERQVLEISKGCLAPGPELCLLKQSDSIKGFQMWRPVPQMCAHACLGCHESLLKDQGLADPSSVLSCELDMEVAEWWGQRQG